MLLAKCRLVWQSGAEKTIFKNRPIKKKTIHCSNHVCEKMETKRAVCIDDFKRMLPTKFLFNWQNGFREDHFYKSANQTEELPVVVIFGTK